MDNTQQPVNLARLSRNICITRRRQSLPTLSLGSTPKVSLFNNNPADSRPVSALSIAGSDSGGGAGIQADLRSFDALGVHGLTAIAALTAQTTCGVSAVHPVPVAFLAEQMRVLLDDFKVGAIKIGMLADAERIRCVAGVLAEHPHIPVVLEPVMVASSGARLLQADAVEALRQELLPRCSVVTPNLPEAEVLAGRPLPAAEDRSEAAAALRAAGAGAVLMKGGHVEDGNEVIDRLYTDEGVASWRHPRLAVHGHGTGCSLSAALAALLAQGLGMEAACDRAIAFVHEGLRAAYAPGRGDLHVLGHRVAGQRLREG